MEFFKRKPPSISYKTEPVVTAKREKARGMGTTIIIPRALESSAESQRNPARRGLTQKSPAEIYYEGYVDDQKQLVPDSNLEAMKDTINLKMRVKTSLRFKNESRFEHLVYEHLRRRLSSMVGKVNSPTTSDDGSELKAIKSGEQYRPTEEEQLLRMSNGKESKKETVSTEGDSKLSVELNDVLKLRLSSNMSDDSEHPPNFYSSKTSALNEPLFPSRESTDSGEYRSRFIISGHLGSDDKPIYIIQEYEGQASIFQDQPIHFKTAQEDGNVSVSISAKLFKDNILIEQNGYPQSLNLTPNKISIDPDKCKIFFDFFEETLNIEGVDILLKGKFLANETKRQLTPYLSLKIVRHNVASPKISCKMNKLSRRKITPKVFYKPVISRGVSRDVQNNLNKNTLASKSRSFIEIKELGSKAETRGSRFLDNETEAAEAKNKSLQNVLPEKDETTYEHKKTKEKVSTDIEKMFKQMSFLHGIFKNSG
uniref:Uncharacterized protein n=1 Tax=Graphocephala atropunctata TaxID=36148 RepID=A0A1B6LUU2_9HEMI